MMKSCIEDRLHQPTSRSTPFTTLGRPKAFCVENLVLPAMRRTYGVAIYPPRDGWAPRNFRGAEVNCAAWGFWRAAEVRPVMGWWEDIAKHQRQHKSFNNTCTFASGMVLVDGLTCLVASRFGSLKVLVKLLLHMYPYVEKNSSDNPLWILISTGQTSSGWHVTMVSLVILDLHGHILTIF